MVDEPPRDPIPFDPLSQREREILTLLAQDLTDRQIASRLVLAYTTVKWHNRQIFNKLGVENRQQAVERASALGYLKQSAPAVAPLHNLPPQLTPFVGRQTELEEIAALLGEPETRMITLLAPGGMGKTRLALEAAQRALENFVDGVFFVPLAPLTAADQIVPAIADSVGLQLFADKRTPKQQILDYFRAKRALLLLDNFEHLLEGAELLADLLNSAPGVKLLVTSRERLNLSAETVYPLGGLPYPPQKEATNRLDYSAVQLFVQCARRASSRFIAEDEASLVRVCQLVQGMPLAIELAAAWAGTLSPSAIADEIERSADFLRTTMRNAPERLRSIRAVFEATWRRLTIDEQQVFRRLSVFRGGCTREAAQQIAGVDLLALAGLVDKALVWHHADSGRYEVHELLRQYATEQLEAAGESEATQNDYRDYFGRLAQEWGRALKTPRQLEALEVLEADFDNLREAFRQAIATRKAEVIEPFSHLWYFYEIRTRFVEGEKTFGVAIESLRGQDSVALARLLVGQAVFYERFYRSDLEARFGEESAAMFQRLRQAQERAFSLAVYGIGINNSGDRERPTSLFREAYEIALQYDDLWTQGILLVCLATDALYFQRYDEAKAFLSQDYALVTRLGNHWGLAFVLGYLADLAYEDGDYEEAKRLHEVAVTSAREVRHLTRVGAGLDGLRRVALAQGDSLLARRYAHEELKIEQDLGNRLGIFWATVHLAEVELASGRPQEARGYLHEALPIIVEVTGVAAILDFGLTAAQYLAQTNTEVEAVMLLAFLNHHPKRNFLMKSALTKIQRLITQMQSDLPADTYAEAYEMGRTLTQESLLAKLHVLI